MSTPPQTRESTGASSRMYRCLWFVGVGSIVLTVLVIVLAGWLTGDPAWLLHLPQPDELPGRRSA